MYGNGISLTEKVLDFLWCRQNLTINNIANVDTPGFKTQYLTFEEELGNRIRQASSAHEPGSAVAGAISRTNGIIHTTTDESTRLDGNNVDMDQEQVELVRTAYEYQYMINSITSELNRLQNAAKSF